MRTRIVTAFLFSLMAAVPSFAAITGILMTTDGKAVAGAKVTLHAPETPDARRVRLLSADPERPTLATTQTDSKGTFSLESPKDRAVLDLRVVANGFAPEWRRIERDEELGAIGLRRAESRRGTIRANGKPVVGAKVIWGAGQQEVVAITDEAGGYAIADPAKWATTLSILHPDYAVLELTRAFLDDPARLTKSLDRTLSAGAPFSGTVVGEDGKTPVAKAAIVVDGWPLATSGDDGAFTIAHLRKDWSLMEARTANLLGIRVRTADEKSTTLRLRKAATIAGTIRDAKSGTPVANAQVRLAPTARFDMQLEGAATVTDAKGAYTLAPVAAGEYRMIATHPSYAMQMQTVVAGAGARTVRDVAATQLARISGTVSDEDKQPVAGALISTQATTRENFQMMRMMREEPQSRSGPDGRFMIRVEPEQELRVAAAKKGVPSARSDSMKPAAGEKKRGVLLTLPRGHAVTGRVVDGEGNPVAGVSVISRESEGGGGGMRRMVLGANARESEEDQIRTAADGSFAVRVKEGSYDFAFRREGFAMKTVRAIQVGASTAPLEVKLDPGVEISGRVTRGGTGVEGVDIMSFMSGESNRVTTGPDGSFRLSDLTPGPVMLNFIKTDEFIQEMRNVSAPADNVNIELPPGGRITGRVTDKATGQPVTTFQAGLSGARSGGPMTIVGPPLVRSFTSDDGTFTLENVPAGSAQVVVSAAGYTTARLANVKVEEGRTTENVEVQLDTGVRLVGKVTGPDGSPLVGASIRQDTMPGARGVRMPGMDVGSTTDANGEYAIEALEPGEKSFQFTRQGYLAATKTVDLSSKETRLDVQLTTGMRVTGVVTTDSGAPVPDASVNASSASAAGFGSSARTDANGAFTLEGLEPGRYTFNAQKNGYADGSVRDVDISSGAPVRIALRTGGVIYGHVSGLQESEYAAATVEARSAEGNASASVDPSGNYRIEGAPSGTVRVSANISRGFISRKTSATKSVQVDPGSSVQLDLEFRSETVVSGRVTRDGRPLSNGSVAFFPRRGTAQTTSSTATDSDGRYSVSGLEDGEYSVNVVDMQRLAPHSTTYEVRGSGTFDIDMRTSTLRGRVIDAATNEPVADARVQIRANDGSAGGGFVTRNAMTDAGGGFVAESITSGRYSITADKEGYGNETQDVQIGESSSPRDLEFKLARNDGVTLSVVDARDGRMLSATAVVFDMQGRVIDSAFRFGGGAAEPVRLSLSPGQYRVSVSASGYATQNLVITSPGQRSVGLTPGGTLLVRSRSTTPRRARLVDATGQPYSRGGGGFRPGSTFVIDASPGTTTLQNIAPGTYTLQTLNDNDAVTGSEQVTVYEGQTAMVDL